MGFEADDEECSRIREVVRGARPAILFVGLGSPKQEQWIVNNKDACGAALNIGVGISFSFLSGDVRRAPRWMQRFCLEWAHRMMQEPGRLWRRYLVDDLAFFPLVLREMCKRALRPYGPRDSEK
jgi:N-acetylglucosaminyldiphosphoundecaprenol N-acetyl-beta-D-mannosaminyltransferase